MSKIQDVMDAIGAELGSLAAQINGWAEDKNATESWTDYIESSSAKVLMMEERFKRLWTIWFTLRRIQLGEDVYANLDPDNQALGYLKSTRMSIQTFAQRLTQEAPGKPLIGLVVLHAQVRGAISLVIGDPLGFTPVLEQAIRDLEKGG